FADWLDEQAGLTSSRSERAKLMARAEFIRVQIALARLPVEESGCSRDDPTWPRFGDPEAARSRLLTAESALLQGHAGDWLAPFHGLATGPEFRRGFVEEVKVTARQYLRHAHELFAAGPIRHLYLLDGGASLPAVLRSPYLGRLSALTVYAQHAG